MEINWIQIGFGALTGGLTGALTKQYFDNRKNRLQPISYSIELKSFYNSDEHSIIPSKIILKENDQDYSFCSLYIGSLNIINSGSVDFSNFTFGLTIDEDAKFINIKQEELHRHHKATFNILPTITNQTSILDVMLDPFHRKKTYKFNFVIASNSYIPSIECLSLELTTTQSVKLIKISKDKSIDITFDIAKTLLQIGPIKVTLSR
jgi:hypothetical protein